MKKSSFSISISIISYFLLFSFSISIQAQLSQEDIHRLKEKASINGWTFEIGETPATKRSLNELTGYIPPDPQFLDELQFEEKPIIPIEKLPSRWDWREKTPGGLPPIRDQDSCGSCWAFATVGALECAIKIKDGINVDLSEQWLVDCATGLFWYGCDGGISAHDWHKGSRTDSCGGYGAVLENDYPYIGYNSSGCNCPKPHYYTIRNWSYVGPMLGIPSLDALKTAIYRYGPIVASMEAKESFQAYKGGVYNDNSESKALPNHMVVIVGWDDNYGGGSFIIRNSWGPYWGENGYGYIAYGTAQIGYGADYIEYGTPLDNLVVTPQQNLLFYLSSNNFISPSSIGIRLENIGEYNINWTSTADSGIALNPSSGTLRSGEYITIQLTITQIPAQSGTYIKNFSITNTSTQNTQNFKVKLKKAYPAPIVFNLNTDPGWDKTGNWSFGKPAGLNNNPSSGYTGQYVYGYNLNGAYENNMGEEVLISHPIDCSNFRNITLSFYRWLGIEDSEYDQARVDVSTNGTTWTTIWKHSSDSFQETSWSLQTYNLSSIADRQPLLLIRWVMGPTDYSISYSGWNIDDISISGNPANVTVPNLIGKTLQEAISNITSAGLTQGQTNWACSNSIPEGSVSSQFPQAGTSVPYGTQVNLTVSSGFCPVIVPNVTGLSLTSAENQITSNGLTTGTIEYLCNDSTPENNVINQSPEAGIEVPYGTAVHLIISTGPCPQEGTIGGNIEGEVEGEGINEEGEEGNPDGIIEGNTEGSTEGVPEGTSEGSIEGILEGTAEGTNEGWSEGIIEGTSEGSYEGIVPEGITEGIGEGSTEGTTEGDGEGVVSEGTNEGIHEGTPEGASEGPSEGIIEGTSEGATEGEPTPTYHSSDQNKDNIIDLSELLRVIQFFNSGGYHCEKFSEDGYAPGISVQNDCIPHTSDYNPQNWIIELSELLRLIQLFNSGTYYLCIGFSEDNYCPLQKEN